MHGVPNTEQSRCCALLCFALLCCTRILIRVLPGTVRFDLLPSLGFSGTLPGGKSKINRAACTLCSVLCTDGRV